MPHPCGELRGICPQQEWEVKRISSCTKRQLQSLIGTLKHACQVVRPGRSFLRRMIKLERVPKRPHYFVRLNTSFRADLRWWRVFINCWNGVSVIPGPARDEVVVTSDASGSWGCGAWTQDSWLQYKWPDNCDLYLIQGAVRTCARSSSVGAGLEQLDGAVEVQ